MKKIEKRNSYWNELLLVFFAILLTIWQFDLINFFSEYKAFVSKIIYLLISCCLIYFIIDSYKNRYKWKKSNYYLFLIVIIFLLLLFILLLLKDLIPRIGIINILGGFGDNI